MPIVRNQKFQITPLGGNNYPLFTKKICEPKIAQISIISYQTTLYFFDKFGLFWSK